MYVFLLYVIFGDQKLPGFVGCVCKAGVGQEESGSCCAMKCNDMKLTSLFSTRERLTETYFD